MTKKNHPTAIVINSDITQARTISWLLSKINIETQIFTDGYSALNTLANSTMPDLIVADLFMPDINGWQFCRLIRSPEFKHLNKIPLIIISAIFSHNKSLHITDELDADAFIPLPLDTKHFLEEVKILLSGEKKKAPLKALIIEDDKSIAYKIKMSLETYGYIVEIVISYGDGKKLIRKNTYNVAVIDRDLPEEDYSFIEYFHSKQPDCILLIIAEEPTQEMAITWMKQGAYGYKRKPFQIHDLGELCARARREHSIIAGQEIMEIRNHELQESKEKYHLAFENANIGMCIINLEGRFIHVNETLCRIWGYEKNELIGLHINDVSYPEDHDISPAYIQTALDGIRINDKFKKRYIHKDGHIVYGHVSISLVRDIKGTPLYFISHVQDITEQKRAEDALRESEQKYRDLFECSRDGIVVVDNKGTILDANSSYCNMLGYTLEELKGMNNFLQITPKKWQTWEQEEIWNHRLMKDGYSGIYEKDYVRKDGTILPVELQSFTISDRKGNAKYLWSIVRNITDRKAAEEEREKLQSQLIHAQKMESVGRLAGGVAHDFNNMLGIILGFSEVILEDIDNEDPFYIAIKGIEKAANRSANLTRQLLAFARKQAIDPKILDINDTVSGMISMLRHLIGEDIELVWIPGGNLWSVKIDPLQLDQILANLCVNARDSISGIGRITIETENITIDDLCSTNQPDFIPGDYVILSVSDNGCGMEKNILEHIFEPFFTTKEVGKGTGLGLATIYGIVKQNEGLIDVYSKPGLGTTFKIYLPKFREKPSDITSIRVEEILETGNETILLVEDEPGLLNMIKFMLKKLGYNVIATSNPLEAIELAKEYGNEIQLLITDVIMPEMNGRDLQKIIASLYRNIKCLFMSGYTAEVIAHHGVLDEGLEFIQKPFSKKALAKRVRNVLDDK